MRLWLALFCLAASPLGRAETFSFALIGDVPYSSYERRELPGMLAALAEQNVSFVVHVGDIKHGRERCDDRLFEDRYQLFNNTRVPFIFIPGDNEWTDCSRLSNGAYDPLERLGKLRQLFWSDNRSLGQTKLLLEQQAGAYPEHARFRRGAVLFVTLNIPGANNYGLNNQPAAEALQRTPALISWMQDSFALARREKLAGIVLLFQADPAFKHFARGVGHLAFAEFLTTLRAETLNFPGQVVAVHGDSHISRIDQPLRDTNGQIINNFYRVETFGYPIMGWTRGIFDNTASPPLRFEAHAWPAGQ